MQPGPGSDPEVVHLRREVERLGQLLATAAASAGAAAGGVGGAVSGEAGPLVVAGLRQEVRALQAEVQRLQWEQAQAGTPAPAPEAAQSPSLEDVDVEELLGPLVSEVR